LIAISGISISIRHTTANGDALHQAPMAWPFVIEGGDMLGRNSAPSAAPDGTTSKGATAMPTASPPFDSPSMSPARVPD
jgi:hypothetical protein